MGQSRLLVVAHPDDETLFFGGLVLSSPGDWAVACVTDGDADGQGRLRQAQFLNACKELGVQEIHWLGFPDNYETRLDQGKLQSRLRDMGRPELVYTHSPIGEYGHPHHQDVSAAVHEVFSNQKDVWSVAYNCWPDEQRTLEPSVYEKKCRILSEIYASETQRFIHLLPATATEGFAKVSLTEVRAIYQFLTENKTPPARALKKYSWYWPFLKAWGVEGIDRPF